MIRCCSCEIKIALKTSSGFILLVSYFLPLGSKDKAWDRRGQQSVPPSGNYMHTVKPRNVDTQKCGHLEMWTDFCGPGGNRPFCVLNRFRNVDTQKCGHLELWTDFSGPVCIFVYILTSE